ncbi:glutathione S-transferase omega-1-like protein [Dinothrombium tinctorium]|uniref:Glutathione S-transferase omega-1-like protein n=1 Tax=Dinothrombium tinctorium TaxID=1965070 RepID=A0A3S3PIX6_9ACAR|nr:glutathione S-transferase omega-1-like protein [Dinothrombium tinctorium]
MLCSLSSSIRQTVNRKMSFKFLENNYTKGSTEPEKKPGVARIFSFQLCPYAERVLLVASAKSFNFDLVNVDLANKPEWLFEKNKFGLVPVLELEDGNLLHESLIIADYIDEATDADHKLHPQNLFEKYRQKLFVQEFATAYPQFIAKLKSGSDDIDVTKEVENFIRFFESELSQRNTRFVGSNESPQMVDYMIWPFVERLPAVISLGTQIKNWEQHLSENAPLILKYMQAMKEDPAVKQNLFSPDTHIDFLLSVRERFRK